MFMFQMLSNELTLLQEKLNEKYADKDEKDFINKEELKVKILISFSQEDLSEAYWVRRYLKELDQEFKKKKEKQKKQVID